MSRERRLPTTDRRRSHDLSFLGARSPPAATDEKPSLNFEDVFTELVGGSAKRGLHPNTDVFTTLADSGAHWIT